LKRDKLLQIVSEIIKISIEEIERKSDQDLKTWDSLGHIEIVSSLEREFSEEGKFLNIDISDCTNFKKLETKLVEHGYIY
jgi:acyl carrier protein